MIKKRQFDILTYLLKCDTYSSQRELSEKMNTSLGTVNNDIRELNEKGYVLQGKITEAGKEALQPYKVERAVFIAAGMGFRMLPITLNTPKPLIKVKGKRIIDTLLDAVLAAGINEIYLVRGYLSKSFDVLLEKYPMIQFIENEQYNEANNILSALLVKDKFKNAYVFDSDLLLYNQDLITPYQYSSNYLGIPMDRTDDWCLKTKSGRITGMHLGGRHCYHMVGVSYWTKADGEEFEKDIVEVFESPGGKKRYWDQVILEYKIEKYKVRVRKCNFDDIIEIDTFNDLKEIDHIYDL